MTEATSPGAPPGTLLLPDRKRLLVMCGDGAALALEQVQLQGRGRVDAASFRNGQRIEDNERLGESTS